MSLFDEWDSPQARAQRAAELHTEAERDRQAMCELLRHRGQDGAALIVAAAQLTSDCVDNWDGGQYEVNLSVPAVMYDVASGEEVRAQLSAAAEAVVTAKHYRRLEITLRRGGAPAGWDAAVFADIVTAARAHAQAGSAPAALLP